MFESKKCRRCGKALKGDWIACPYCGQDTRVRKHYNMFENIDKEFERIDKVFGPMFIKFPKFDMENPFKGGGINIIIKSGPGMKPEIKVNTAGEYRKIEPEIKRKLGVREGIGGVEERVERKQKIPKVTEEPETKIEKTGNKETINIKLPDVKNPNDIEIRKLEQSLEIKAFAGDKAYFKLIPIRPNIEILNKSFKDGLLKIEVMG